MLPRAGLRDYSLLTHPPGQQALANRVIDLVRAGVIQVLALQENLRPAELFRKVALR